MAGNKNSGNKNAKPPRHTMWKKGQSGNPAGSKPRALSRASFRELVESQWTLDREGIAEILKDPTATMGELIVAKVLERAMDEGDYNRINGMLDRVLGKVRFAVEVSTKARPELKMLNADGTPRMIASNDVVDGEVDDD